MKRQLKLKRRFVKKKGGEEKIKKDRERLKMIKRKMELEEYWKRMFNYGFKKKKMDC